MADPDELIRIWAADCWFMTPDRGTFGNILLVEPDDAGRFHLAPADQSDCFLGSGSLADSSFRERSNTHGAAPYLPLLERALLERGCGSLQEMAARIAEAAVVIPAALGRVPAEWWTAACIDPGDLGTCLHERATRVRAILELEKWKGLTDATAGGYNLDL